MGILGQVSRIIDVVLTDKAKQILVLENEKNLTDLITKFAIFDDDINYENVDFSLSPSDPNYPTFFGLEPVISEKASAFKSKLITLRPGSGIYKKVFPENQDFPDGLRVIETTPSTADLKQSDSVTVTVQSKEFQRDTGEPIFDDETLYVVYLKDPSDAQYIQLSELVEKVTIEEEDAGVQL